MCELCLKENVCRNILPRGSSINDVTDFRRGGQKCCDDSTEALSNKKRDDGGEGLSLIFLNFKTFEYLLAIKIIFLIIVVF